MRRLRGEDLLLTASGLAFYAVVSLAPLVIVSLWVASLVAGDRRVHLLAQALKEAAPQSLGIDALLQRVAEQGTSAGAGAAVAALWPGLAYGSALVRGFDRSGPGERELRGIRGRALAILVILPLFVLGGIGASYLGTTVLQDGPLSRALGIGLALVGGFLAAAAMTALIYVVFPPRRLAWGALVRATLSVAAGISVLSLIFVVFLTAGANFREHYATSSVGLIVLLGVWLFLANALLLAGYEDAIEGSR